MPLGDDVLHFERQQRRVLRVVAVLAATAGALDHPAPERAPESFTARELFDRVCLSQPDQVLQEEVTSPGRHC